MADAPGESTDDLQFATPEPISDSDSIAKAATQRCAICRQPITSTYFALRDKVLCPACCQRVNAPRPGTRAGRLVKAGLLGLGAGLVGAVIWFLIRRLAHVEIGLVAVLVGYMVGKAVRKGSGNRGGRGYQVIAVILTYCCIAANYMPDVVEAFMNETGRHHLAASSVPNASSGIASNSSNDSNSTSGGGTPAPAHKKIGVARAATALIIALALIFVIALAAPFLGAAEHPIGLLIIGFALWQAWKMNRSIRLAITGPYQIGSSATGGMVA